MALHSLSLELLLLGSWHLDTDYNNHYKNNESIQLGMQWVVILFAVAGGLNGNTVKEFSIVFNSF